MFGSSWLPCAALRAGLCDGGFIFSLSYLYLFMHTGVQHEFHSGWCSCRLVETRRVQLVAQELLTFPEHLSSFPVFSWICGAWSLAFCVVFCRSLCVLLYFFFWQLCCLFFIDMRILITSLWYRQPFLHSSMAIKTIVLKLISNTELHKINDTAILLQWRTKSR